jgi:hypothetical protein
MPITPWRLRETSPAMGELVGVQNLGDVKQHRMSL